MAASGFDEIPVVDVSRLFGTEQDRRDIGEELGAICHRVGFFVVDNHGVPSRLIDDVFAMMQTFFAFPEDKKRLIDKMQSPHFRGWEAIGSEYTNNRKDFREQIDVWSEWPAVADPDDVFMRLMGPNQWLPDDVLAGHRELSMKWISALSDLADRILGVLALGLGLDEDQFRRHFGEQPMSLAKFISYPPTPAGHAGVNAHHDTGYLTVLATGGTAGLQVENPDGDWVSVPPHRYQFVINLGEMLQAMTGNYFAATPHRVITSEARLSAGYFHGPSLPTELELLPLEARFAEAVAASAHHSAAGYMALKEETEAGVGDMRSATQPTVYGEQLWNYFGRSYPANMAQHHGDVAAT